MAKKRKKRAAKSKRKTAAKKPRKPARKKARRKAPKAKKATEKLVESLEQPNRAAALLWGEPLPTEATDESGDKNK
jgi:hypothetical protein